MVQPMYASTMPVVDARKRGRRPNRSMNREKVTETTRDRMVWPPLSCEIHPSALALMRDEHSNGAKGRKGRPPCHLTRILSVCS